SSFSWDVPGGWLPAMIPRLRNRDSCGRGSCATPRRKSYPCCTSAVSCSGCAPSAGAVRLVASGVLVAVLLLMRRSLSAPLATLLRTISARWPPPQSAPAAVVGFRAAPVLLVSGRRRGLGHLPAARRRSDVIAGARH